MLVLFGIWSSYFAGAVVGTQAMLQWELLALAMPLGGLITLVVYDVVRPFAVGKQA